MANDSEHSAARRVVTKQTPKCLRYNSVACVRALYACALACLIVLPAKCDLLLKCSAKRGDNRGSRSKCGVSAPSELADNIFSLFFCAPLMRWSDSDTEAHMCLDPKPAWISGTTKNGKPRLVFKASEGISSRPNYFIPCGKCLGCQVDRRNRWISRMQLEHYCHDDVGTFITLTYANAPKSVKKKDVQNFLKRFRNLTRDFGISLPNFKYFFCAEYGTKFGRPHYHGLLFGLDCFNPSFDTRIVSFKDGYPVYSSPILEKIWKHGFITVDRISSANIRYVSKYILKAHQKVGDEFTLKSIGLGSDFFFRFPSKSRQDVKPSPFFSDYDKGLIHFASKGGKMQSLAIPYKAFDRYCEKVDSSLLDVLKAIRRDYALKHPKTVHDVAARREWLTVMTATKPNERALDDES